MNLKQILYNLFIRHNGKIRELRNALDTEMSMIPDIVLFKRTALDIGANTGIYSGFLSKHFEKVLAFEPLDEVYRMLEKFKWENVALHQTGLSDIEGQFSFYTPVKGGIARFGNSSYEKEMITGRYPQYKEVKINTQTLDHYRLKNVDFIKIDVEGHELKVLKGGLNTIRSNKPVLLIESEQRHLSGTTIYDVFKYVTDLGYKGFFVLDGTNMRSLDTFDVNEHQTGYIVDNEINLKKISNEKVSRYINNFFFLPDNR